MNNENQNIEYKESWRDEYVKWLCGFANAQGGKLYIGINDKGEVCGVENAHRLSEDIPNKVVSFEIWNEGELPEGYTQETLFASHSSKPRNHKIANVFFKAGFIDTWGRGFQKIRDGFEADGIPMPKVENFCGGVRVSIERTVFMKLSHVGSSVGSDVTSSVTSFSPVKLTERQQDMLELIRKNPFISAQQMSVVLSVVKRTIERDLADLQKKGILIREGNTSAGHWEIIEK